MPSRAPVFAAALVLALITLAAGSGSAQIPYDPARNQGIGVAAGLASGAGISYQEILPSAFGFRATLFGWKLGDSSFVDVGGSGIRVLSDDGRRRIYLIGGASYWRESEEETIPEFDEQGNVVGEREENDVDQSWAIGIGAGVEIPFTTRAVLSLEGLFTYWDRTGDLLPLPQVAIHYPF